MLHDYPISSILVPAPTPAIPTQPRTSSEDSPRCNRTTYLRRSIFRLIYESIYLALTDPKLLGWYLGLPPEDRKIIQDEGGFHQFLKRHPALELSKHHVYVKKTVPEELRENLLPTGNSTGYNQHHNSFNTSYSTVPQRGDPKVQELSKLTWQMANCGGYNVLKNPEPLANYSLDMELEKRTQDVNPHSASNKHMFGKELSSEYSHFDSVVRNTTHNNSNLMLQGGDSTSINEEAFYSILETDKSIVLCVPKENPSLFPPVQAASDLIDNSVTRSTTDRSTSPVRLPQKCDVMVGTDETRTWSAPTQTEQLQMEDKTFNTEVFMLDLDYLTKEFITIKTERDELLEKVKMQRIKSPFARIVNDLKKLETDYNKMREKIMSGISLQDLKPLSVDSEDTTTDNQDIKIITDMKTASLGSPNGQDNTPSDSPPSSPESDNSEGSQESPKIQHSTIRTINKTKGVVTLVPKTRGTHYRPEGKDLSSTEAWYDAEEDLPSEVSEAQQKVDPKHTRDDISNDEKNDQETAGLCVSGLPKNVTKSDVMLWFQKYNVSEVRISNFKYLRVAIVIVGGTHLAEAAVKELNGLRIKDSSLRVELISSGQKTEDQTSIDTTDHTEGLKSANRNLFPSSPLSTPTKKKVVCVSPTAQGTFVPQHYGTMGSFDILMSELTQRHPSVGRQKIVDALLELRAKYRGVLSGLPLRTIREMTSELLTRPEPALTI